MKFSRVKTVVGLSVVGAAVIFSAACSAGLSAQTGLNQGVSEKSPVAVAAIPAAAKQSLSAPESASRETISATYEAGTLLKGETDPVIYLITGAGTRRPIYGDDTFAAFGFQPEDVIAVEDDVLSALPQALPVTRLAVDAQENLYWVVDGNRVRVNEWKPVVADISYSGPLVTPLDGTLQKNLPIRGKFKWGSLLRQDDDLFYYMYNSVVPVEQGDYDGVAVLELPSGVVTVYPQKANLKVFGTTLNAETHLANLRAGPGLEFEVVSVVEDTDRFLVRGRAEGSKWLQVQQNGRYVWLAGDLIAHQYLIDLLPEVTFEPVEEIGVAESAQVEATQPPVEVKQPVVCNARPIRGFGETWDNYPEVREWLGCPFTNFRRDEHATPAAVQTFERGWMLWLETDTVANVDPIYVFFEDDHSYIRYGDRPLVDAHSYFPTPRGYYKVGDHFAKVYWEELDHRQRARLGFAINEARDSNGAFQEFENGRMFWAGEADTIYTIYQGYFDLNGDGQVTWTQGWNAYEDTFEAPEED